MDGKYFVTKKDAKEDENVLNASWIHIYTYDWR